ncbi:MAG: hypothetical protein HOE54_12055 [Gammaproteobacteria bacterium]|jgi:cell division protein FtsQ|nr:hypothetical protein [Gammaproteobacteria bacterium]
MLRSGFVAAVIVISGVLVFAKFSIDLSAVEKVAIVGELSEEQLVDIRQQLASLEESERGSDLIRSKLIELPWVDYVGIRREWPLGMSIEVRPQRVMAYWNDNGFINHEGRVLVTDRLQGGDLPFLYGAVGTELDVMSRYQQLGSMLKSHGHDIRVLRRSDRGSWTIETRKGIEVLLGKEDLRARLDRFLEVSGALRRQGDGREIGRMDARYINGVAVRFVDDKELNLGSPLVTDSRNDINKSVGVRSL